MAGFQSPIDLCNRACQLMRLPEIYSFQDMGSMIARELSLAYDPLRVAELRRACWRFSTRRVMLRAVSPTTMLFNPPNWSSVTAYEPGDIVSYQNYLWVSIRDTNTNQTPGVVPAGGFLYWDSYYGPVTIDLFNGPIVPTQGDATGQTYPTTYNIGELVYMTPGDGTYTIYRSLVNNNANTPNVPDQWADATAYSAGQVVSYNSVNYQSLVNLNINNQPGTSPSQWTSTVTSPLVSNSWEAMTTSTLEPLDIIWPIGTGPTTEYYTNNVYHLPAGFLRQAPDDPKAGLPFMWLGGPTGNVPNDWVLEGNYIVSAQVSPIMFRFVADVQSVRYFDSLFSVALASRLALELAARLVDNSELLPIVLSEARETYNRTVGDARAINGIETGPIIPAEDSWISCRV